MPVFNAGIFLRPAIESILGQCGAKWELLIVDDGGTDGSLATVAAFPDPRLRVLAHGPGRPNRGIAASRNRALAEAQGEFVAFLNHDDTCHPERLARQLAFFHAHAEINALGCAIENITADGKFISRASFPESHLGIRWLGLLDCPVRQSALMARRHVFTAQRLHYNEAFAVNSDYEFIERMTRVTSAANLPESLVSYRKHDTNTSRLRYAEFVDAGNRIAHDAIQHELPAFAITPEEIAAVRAVVLGYQPPSARRSLIVVKRAWELYLDLFAAFREKHRARAGIDALHPSSPASS